MVSSSSPHPCFQTSICLYLWSFIERNAHNLRLSRSTFICEFIIRIANSNDNKHISWKNCNSRKCRVSKAVVFYIFSGNAPPPPPFMSNIVTSKVLSSRRNEVTSAPRVASKAQYFISPDTFYMCCTYSLRLDTYTWQRIKQLTTYVAPICWDWRHTHGKESNNNISCTYSLRHETYTWFKIKHITTYIAPAVWDSRHTHGKESHK